jgi:hypothetical protein
MRGQRRVRVLRDNLVNPVKDDRAERDTQRSTLRQSHGVFAAKERSIGTHRADFFCHLSVKHSDHIIDIDESFTIDQ